MGIGKVEISRSKTVAVAEGTILEKLKRREQNRIYGLASYHEQAGPYASA